MEVSVKTILPRNKYYKLIRKGWKHNEYQFKEGINYLDAEEMRRFQTDPKVGFYFCRFEDLPYWARTYEDLEYICSVDIAPNSRMVRMGKRKYKTDIIILYDPIDILDYFSTWFNGYELVMLDPFLIRYIREPNDVMCLDAVKASPHILQYIGCQTVEICIEAVKRNGLALRHVKIQCPEICLEAVKQNGLALGWVKFQESWAENSDDRICIAALRQNPMALVHVKKQTIELCLEAVERNGLALKYVKFQTKQIVFKACEQNGYAIEFADPEVLALMPPFSLMKGRIFWGTEIVIY